MAKTQVAAQPAVEVSLQGELLAPVLAIAPATDWERWLQVWLVTLNVQHSPIHAYELSLQFTSDAAIQSLNTHYRSQDRPTDVLSFAALESEMPLPPALLASTPLYLGDLIISVETAERQCQQHGHTLLEELVWLAAHGLLHLLGWDHPNEAGLQGMLTQQQRLLRDVGFSLSASAYRLEAGYSSENDGT